MITCSPRLLRLSQSRLLGLQAKTTATHSTFHSIGCYAANRHKSSCSRLEHGRIFPRQSCTTHTAVAAVPAFETAQETASVRVSKRSPGSETQAALELLESLSCYSPTGLLDGPASLAQVRPYNAAEVQQALNHGARLLSRFTYQKLSNIAAALAAAGHLDTSFLEHLGSAAARKLKAAPTVDDHVAALAELKALCFLAVAYARLGLLQTELFEQIASRGASLLHRHKILYPRKRTHGTHLALLAAALAALKLYPPQLFKALGELFKQQRHVLWLLGPEEAMLLLWAFARVQHKDRPAQLLLTQRAATQVGQLDCQGLAHAYTQCASAGLTAPPLLAALRKSTRQRLRGMKPHHLTAVLVALASTGQQDSLLLDELSGALHNKMANMTAAQISACFTACSILRYRNPWLFEQASIMLVSQRLAKAAQLTAVQLADILLACNQLEYRNSLLFAHLGSVAAESLCPSWSAADLAVVLQGYHAVGYYQPQLLLAAAQRLLQLAQASAGHPQQQYAGPEDQQQQQMQGRKQDLELLAAAAYWLAQLPSAGGSAQEKGSCRAAVHAVAAAVLQDQQQHSCRLAVWLKIAVALLLVDAGAHAAHDSQQQHQQGQQGEFLSAVLQPVLDQLAAVYTASDLQAVGVRELLQLMQLLWLADAGTGLLPKQQQVQQQQQQATWHLGLQDEALTDYLLNRLEAPVVQQQERSALLTAVLPVVQRQLQGAVGARVLSPFVLPGSPIVVPAAVVFPGTEEASKPAQSGSQEVVGGAEQPQQGGHLDAGGFVIAEVDVAPTRKVVLPADVVTLLQASQAVGRPVAIFDGDQARAGYDSAGIGVGAWFTASQPRLTMPLAARWQEGLASAGWSVLVLQTAAALDGDQTVSMLRQK